MNDVTFMITCKYMSPRGTILGIVPWSEKTEYTLFLFKNSILQAQGPVVRKPINLIQD